MKLTRCIEHVETARDEAEACQPIAKSAGHVAFVDGFERIAFGPQLFRAPIANVIDTSGRRSGRWECSIEHARRFPTLFPFLEPAGDVTTSRAQASLELTD